MDETGRPKPDCQHKTCPRLECHESLAQIVEGECCKQCSQTPLSLASKLDVPLVISRGGNGLLNDAQIKHREQQKRTRLLNEGGCAVKVTSCCHFVLFSC